MNAYEIAIADYGLGNLGSIQNMLRRIGANPVLASDPETVRRAARIILPGVGGFDAGMQRLESSGLIPILADRAINAQVPILGICLGMQMMTRGSMEGVRPGLGWVPAETRRFSGPAHAGALKVPHMGWNNVVPTRGTSLIEKGHEARFYFVHSYHVCCDRSEHVLAITEYGYPFASVFQVGNLTGVQFHPEKSHQFGMALFRNWIASTSAQC